MPIANGFIKKDDFKKEFFFNMEVGFSDELSLFQLNDHPKPESMFNDQYPFYTGSSEYMKSHFIIITDQIIIQYSFSFIYFWYSSYNITIFNIHSNTTSNRAG